MHGQREQKHRRRSARARIVLLANAHHDPTLALGARAVQCPVFLRMFIAFCALVAFAATAHEPGGFVDFCAGDGRYVLGYAADGGHVSGISCTARWSSFNFLIVLGVFVWMWLLLWFLGRYTDCVRNRLPTSWPFITLVVDANWCLWAMAGACASAHDLNVGVGSYAPGPLGNGTTAELQADVQAVVSSTLYSVCSRKLTLDQRHPHDFGCPNLASQLGAGSCFTFFMWFAYIAVVIIDYKAWKLGGLQRFDDEASTDVTDVTTSTPGVSSV